MLDKIVLFTLTAFTLGSLGQVFRVSGVNLYLFDIAVAGANLYLFLFLLKKKKFYINSPLILFSFFSIFSLIVTLFSTRDFYFIEKLLVLSFWLRFNLYFGFTYFVFNLIKFEFLSLISFKKILKINFYILLALNFIQYFLVGDISFMQTYGFDPHFSRLTGFFLDPNFMGFYLLLYLVLSEFSLKSNYISYLSVTLLFLTESRSAFLSLIVFLIIYLLTDFRKAFNLLLLSLLLFFISNIGNRIEHLSASNDSSSLRTVSWRNALEIYSQAPYFGIGFNNYRNYLIGLNITSPENYYSNSSNFSDSSWLSVLVFSGIIGLILFFSIFLSYGSSCKNLILVILLILNSTIINSLFFPSLTILIFLIMNLNLLED